MRDKYQVGKTLVDKKMIEWVITSIWMYEQYMVMSLANKKGEMGGHRLNLMETSAV